MKPRNSKWPLAACFLCLLAACAKTPAPPAAPAAAVTAAAGPFDADSSLPYHFPQFDRIKESDYKPAFEAGMAAQLKEVEAIAMDPQPPSFDNTIVPLEKSGRQLDRVSKVFDNLTSANTNPEHDAIDAEMSPKRAAHHDAIFLNS